MPCNPYLNESSSPPQGREAAGLTQTQAAALVSPAKVASYKTWSAYELEEGNPNRRVIPLAVWELFLLLTDQHPTMQVREIALKQEVAS